MRNFARWSREFYLLISTNDDILIKDGGLPTVDVEIACI